MTKHQHLIERVLNARGNYDKDQSTKNFARLICLEEELEIQYMIATPKEKEEIKTLIKLIQE